MFLKTYNYAVAIYSVAKQWEAAVLLIKTTLGSTDNLIKNTILIRITCIVILSTVLYVLFCREF